MPNNNYIRGRAKEYRCQEDLEAEGYETLRASGSKGKADIIAWNNIHHRHIQVKSESTPTNGTYPAERKVLASCPCPDTDTLELWVWTYNLNGPKRGGWRAKYLVTGPSTYETLLQVSVPRKPRGRKAKPVTAKTAEKKPKKSRTLKRQDQVPRAAV
jgi:hypothetical protein